MKLEHLLIQYFYTSKELSLQGIGKFLLSQDLVLPPDTEKEVVMPENAIGFEFNIKATEDEGLISYIVENTKKIRPLASADLDSFYIFLTEDHTQEITLQYFQTLPQNREWCHRHL